MSINMIEAEIRHTLDKLSNNEAVEIDEQWIDDAAEQFKEAMKKQFLQQEDQGGFRLRMSNIGRPLCQLQMEKSGAPKARRPYNHIIRMAIGDATECIMEIVLRAAGLNVTGGKSKVELPIGPAKIKGEDDIEIDHRVWDTKSASPWAFTNKWADGTEGLRKSDDFGYLAQLTGYSRGQGKDPGGWFVVNKSTGEVAAVQSDLTDEEMNKILSDVEQKVVALENDEPFQRCFEAEEETYYRKPTGSMRLPTPCTFCDFMKTCWPDAVHKPQTNSTAQKPKYYWYAEYAGD